MPCPFSRRHRQPPLDQPAGSAEAGPGDPASVDQSSPQPAILAAGPRPSPPPDPNRPNLPGESADAEAFAGNPSAAGDPGPAGPAPTPGGDLPPWHSGPPWEHNGPPWRANPRWQGRPPWGQGHRPRPRFIFFGLAILFGAVTLLFLLAVSVILVLAFNLAGNTVPRPVMVFLLGCGIPLMFAIFMGILGRWAFRRIGSPLAEIMSAADAVAAGDLSVRVREVHPNGEFGRLARSFNRMTAELGRAEQQRRSLTADVAHELRTPLHIIQGNLEGILDGVYQPTTEHIAATLEETRLLSRLVNDLQTLSLAESGQLPLHRGPVSARDLLDDVITSFAGQAVEAGISLGMETEGADAEITLLADPDRLDQVLSNLVANAMRYTPAGGSITLRAAPFTGDQGQQRVRLTVQDTGPGIPAADLPYVFDRFWRGDRSRSRAEGAGSGLGLAIARQLVQAHGGTITAASPPGQGALFTIEMDAYLPQG